MFLTYVLVLATLCFSPSTVACMRSHGPMDAKVIHGRPYVSNVFLSIDAVLISIHILLAYVFTVRCDTHPQDPALKQAFTAIPALQEAVQLSPRAGVSHLHPGTAVRERDSKTAESATLERRTIPNEKKRVGDTEAITHFFLSPDFADSRCPKATRDGPGLRAIDTMSFTELADNLEKMEVGIPLTQSHRFALSYRVSCCFLMGLLSCHVHFLSPSSRFKPTVMPVDASAACCYSPLAAASACPDMRT